MKLIKNYRIKKEELKKIIASMIEKDQEIVSVNSLGYAVQLTGRGLAFGLLEKQEEK